jgi:hypothetical protein
MCIRPGSLNFDAFEYHTGTDFLRRPHRIAALYK